MGKYVTISVPADVKKLLEKVKGRDEWGKFLLNFKPTITLEDGLTELAEWAKTHGWGAMDLFEKALKELKERHLA